MDQQQMENTIQFLVENQSKFHSDLELLKENVQTIAENQKHTDEQIRALTKSQQEAYERMQTLTERVDDVVGVVDVMRLELRQSFDNLIIANEVTRNLAEQIGKLAVNTSQRLAKLEE
jgi:phosphoenolpyruvate-protein kinase (PTS system EI component)